MSLESFIHSNGVIQIRELEKVRLIAFYLLKVENKIQLEFDEVVAYFKELHLGNPNKSRLKKNVRDSRWFVRGTSDNSFKLHASQLSKLTQQFPNITSKSEDVVSYDSILQETDYKNTYGYIESLAKQINASYEKNIFDGCAVLMRRLLEVLLILAYQNLGIEGTIKDAQDNYYFLEQIVKDAQNNKTLDLSRNTKPLLNKFRDLGNFSAHRIEYNCKKKYIEDVIPQYRASIEELLYKAGLKK